MTERKLEKIILKHIEHNLEIYKQNKDVVLLYEEYIKKITELFDFLMKGNSNLFYTIVFDILVEIGFFSANRKFNSDKEEFKELTIKPGLSIVNGDGVCRNVACFYEDVFKNLYDYPLKLCCLDKQRTVNDDTKIYGNHIINLTLYHDTIYGFDLMNHCIFKAKDDRILTGLDFDYLLEYIPNGDLLLELTTSLEDKLFEFNNNVKLKHILLEISSMRDLLTNEEYEKLINKANEFIIKRKKTLQSFMLKNEELTHEIKNKMLSLK